MRRLLPILLVLAGCASPLDSDPLDRPGDEAVAAGKADGIAVAAPGTRDAAGVLRLLNDGEGTTFELLDDVVPLHRKAAENLVDHRDGPDGRFGTADDDLFDDLAEVDEVRWVGPVALSRLTAFAQREGYLPGDDEVLGIFEGVEFTFGEADRVLGFVDTATAEELREASVPTLAVESILAARPVASIPVLSDLYWVGPRTLEHLLAAVAEPPAAPVEGALCRSTDECADGLTCVGKPAGHEHGKCWDTRSRDGVQDPCAVDADCGEGLVCIGQSVYSRGYCTYDWMRDSFTSEVVAEIPGVAMTAPMAFPIVVFGQASVPEDIAVELDLEHTNPSALWIGLKPPTGQEAVTLWDGSTATGPLPERLVDRAIYRDDMVNGEYQLLVQNVAGRGEGTLFGFTLHVSSRWD